MCDHVVKVSRDPRPLVPHCRAGRLLRSRSSSAERSRRLGSRTARPASHGTATRASPKTKPCTLRSTAPTSSIAAPIRPIESAASAAHGVTQSSSRVEEHDPSDDQPQRLRRRRQKRLDDHMLTAIATAASGKMSTPSDRPGDHELRRRRYCLAPRRRPTTHAPRPTRQGRAPGQNRPRLAAPVSGSCTEASAPRPTPHPTTGLSFAGESDHGRTSIRPQPDDAVEPPIVENVKPDLHGGQQMLTSRLGAGSSFSQPPSFSRQNLFS